MIAKQILDGINNSPLKSELKLKAIERIEQESNGLEKMCESLRFQAPTAILARCQEITEYAMGIITPVLRDSNISEADGTNTYVHIYAALSGEDPKKYLEA